MDVNLGSLFLVFTYFLLLLVLGVVANRRVRSASDYVLAGRSIGFWMFVMLMLGSTTSGMTLLGVSGLGFVAGWPTFWEQIFVPFTCAFAIIFYGFKLFEVCRRKNFFAESSTGLFLRPRAPRDQAA